MNASSASQTLDRRNAAARPGRAQRSLLAMLRGLAHGTLDLQAATESVAGVRQTSRRSRTAKGEMMLFLTLEDLQGTLDVILFPDVYRIAKSFLDSSPPLLISGVMEMDKERGEPYLRADRLITLS